MSILKKEIYEQPNVIQTVLDEEAKNITQITQNIFNPLSKKLPTYIMIAARGTSDNAARYAQYVLGSYNRLPVTLATPSLFTLYNRPPNLKDSFVIGISQSGKSPDIIELLAEAKRQGQPTLAITNEVESPLSKTADYVINLHAGFEKATAATKTYTASLTALALLSICIENNGQRLSELHNVPEWMRQELSLIETHLAGVERYRYMDHCVVIGRGYNYATAFEIALKIKELTRTITEPFSSADFRHGPIAMARDGFPVMVIAPAGKASADIYNLSMDVKQRKAELLMVSENADLLNASNLGFPLPQGIPEWLSPLISIIPGQLFAFTLAQLRGFDPDQPHGITKITETR